MQQPSMGLIEASAIKKRIKLQGASVRDLFSVYIDVFANIEAMLKTPAVNFPPSSVQLIEQALNEMLLQFESLLWQSLDKKIYNDIMLVVPHLQLAIGAITKASQKLNPTAWNQPTYLDVSDQQVYLGATDEFTVALLKCRFHIVQINIQLTRG